MNILAKKRLSTMDDITDYNNFNEEILNDFVFVNKGYAEKPKGFFSFPYAIDARSLSYLLEKDCNVICNVIGGTKSTKVGLASIYQGLIRIFNNRNDAIYDIEVTTCYPNHNDKSECGCTYIKMKSYKR